MVVPRQLIGSGVCSPASTICPPSSFVKQRSFGFSASIYRSESSRWGHPLGSSLAQSSIATTALPTPSWCLVTSLCDEVTLMGRVFLRPRSERRLFSNLPWCFGAGPYRWGYPCRVVLRISTHSIGRRLVQSTYPYLLRDGVTLLVECGLSSHSIGTQSSLDSWLVFLQNGVTLFGSGSHNLISSEGIPRVGLVGAFFQAVLGLSHVILWSPGLL